MIPISINMRFEHIPGKEHKLKEVIDHSIKYAADKLEREMRAKAPGGETGKLKSSIRQGKLFDGRWVGPNTDYDVYVEFGTGFHSPFGKHWIYPRHAPFMVWRDRRTGVLIFARRTKGMRAKPYIRPAIDASGKAISLFMMKEYRRVMKPTKITKT